MPKILLIALLLVSLGLAAQSADTLYFPQPEYINPIHDSFTRNYISTVAMGRGNTGVALIDGLDNVLLNPAGYRPESTSLHLEMLIKPPIGNEGYLEGTNFTSPIPFGSAGVGGKLGSRFSAAALYSLPKSIRVDDFHVLTNQGNSAVFRFPAYNLHQLTLNVAWHSENFHLGLNLNNQVYMLSDAIFLRTFERIQNAKYFLRPQLGLLYTGSFLNAGLSLTPPQAAKWDLKYKEYDSTLPLKAVLGAAYNRGGLRLTAEADLEQTSVIDDAYKDRLMLKVGVENTVRKFTYRAGYIYNPEVWSGSYRLPENTTANADTSIWWANVDTTGVVEANTQHIVTIGTSWHHKDININLAALMDMGGNTKVAQLNFSIDLYFSAFRKQGFLYFD